MNQIQALLKLSETDSLHCGLQGWSSCYQNSQIPAECMKFKRPLRNMTKSFHCIVKQLISNSLYEFS